MRQDATQCDFVVAGGGMAGIAAAVAAARRGLRVTLLHDRPVLGGNASRETRAWLDGAGRGENNRYVRETGLVEELRLENLYRNPAGNVEHWDALLLETVLSHENIDVRLDSAVTEVALTTPGCLASVAGWHRASGLRWTVAAPLFADCTGDAVVASLARAEVRSGRESRQDFNESLAPSAGQPRAGGAALLMALREAAGPIPFVPPRWARSDTGPDVELRVDSGSRAAGCLWVHGGAEMSEIEDDARLRFELLRLAYRALDRLKNSGEHSARTANLALDWVATLPYRFVSRRVPGDYLLTQADLVEQRVFDDAVAAGGASLDEQPSRAALGSEPPVRRFQLPGLYGIPLRSLFSRDVRNLFIAGRHASASHVAAGSLQALATSAQMGEAVGAAARQCRDAGCLPADLLENGRIYALQQDLLKSDHYIPGVRNDDPRDLARLSRITESSHSEASLENADGECPLDVARSLMLPLAGKVEGVALRLRSAEGGMVRYTLHAPDSRGNFFPGAALIRRETRIPGGTDSDWIPLETPLDDAEPGFYWLVLDPAPGVHLATTRESLVGVLSYVRAPGTDGDSGPWTFDRPNRNPFSRWSRIDGNYCFRTDTWIPAFYGGEQVANGYQRPYRTPNIWVSASTDFVLPEWLEFHWPEPREVGSIYLYLNTDLDRELRNLWRQHDLRAIPECIRHYRLLARQGSDWKLLFEERDNHQRHRVHRFPTVSTDRLRLEIVGTHGDPRAQIYEVRIYGSEG